MNGKLEVANPIARIITTLENGEEKFVGVQFKWNGGKLQNQMTDNVWYSEGTLKYVPLTANEITQNNQNPRHKKRVTSL